MQDRKNSRAISALLAVSAIVLLTCLMYVACKRKETSQAHELRKKMATGERASHVHKSVSLTPTNKVQTAEAGAQRGRTFLEKVGTGVNASMVYMEQMFRVPFSARESELMHLLEQRKNLSRFDSNDWSWIAEFLRQGSDREFVFFIQEGIMPLFEGGTDVPRASMPAIASNLYHVAVLTENRLYGNCMLLSVSDLYKWGGEFEKALEINEEVLRRLRAGEAQRDDAYFDACSGRARLLTRLGRAEEAIAQMERLLQERPNASADDKQILLLTVWQGIAYHSTDERYREKAVAALQALANDERLDKVTRMGVQHTLKDIEHRKRQQSAGVKPAEH